MSKSYVPWTPLQAYLLPPSPTEWLPEGHLAYFVLEVVGTLDLGEIEGVIAQKDARGERPYSPRMLTAVLLYGYSVGVFSSRKIAKATYEDVAFRVLCGGSHPHFTTINQFRLDHRERLAGLFVQVLRLCERAGLVKLGHVSLDGTKILANASKHKAMSHERMVTDEARLKKEVEALLAKGEDADRAEDEKYGVGREPQDLPEELRRRKARLERIQAAKAELEREAAEARAAELREKAQEQSEKAGDPSVDETERKRAATRALKNQEHAQKLDGRDDDGGDDDDNSGGTLPLPLHRVATKPDGTPAPKAQRNFTDPDSRIMVKNGAFVQAYNAQIVVDDTAQVIVAEGVSNQAPDSEHLEPMVERTIANAGRSPEHLSADTGYLSGSNVEACERHGIDPYLAAGRSKHGPSPSTPTTDTPTTDTPTTDTPTTKELMRAKLESPAGRAIYSRRKVIVEPPFGQIQAARGFRRFSFRGLLKVRCEWSLVCLTHNLLKLFRSGWSPALAAA